MKRFISLSVLSLLCFIRIIAGTSIVYMNVGDTRTLSFSAPTYIVGTQWTISDQDALQFSPTPGSKAVTATVKALKARSAANRVIVRCTYYYRELNPANGKYEYQRTGYQDWEVIIRDSGSGGGDVNPDKGFVTLNVSSAQLTCGETLGLVATVNNGSTTKYSWSSSNPDVASIVIAGSKATVNTFMPGNTTIRVTISNGDYAECRIEVVEIEPTEVLEFILNDDKESYSVERNEKNSPKGQLTIPSYYNGKPVTKITSKGFGYLSGLEKVSIPNTVTTIEDGAFRSCHALAEIEIPISVTYIGRYAFNYCKKLTHVSLPDNLTELMAFTFRDCTSLTSVTLGDQITSIGESCFEVCTKITSLDIPASVQLIERFALDCDNLTSLYTHWSDPIECSNICSSDVYKKATLYVPQGCKSKYSSVYPWSEFANIREGNYKPSPSRPASIELSSENLEMVIGESVNVSAKVLPETADQVVGWKSSNRSVAYVDTSASQSKIVAVGEGECEIEAYPANYPDACRAVCKVTVKAATKESLSLVGSFNNWDADDLSYTLTKDTDNGYHGSVYIERGANQQFVIVYKNGDETSTFYETSERPIVKESNMSSYSDFEVGRALTLSGKYNITLPSNWPGGIVDVKVPKFDSGDGMYIIFNIERSKLDDPYPPYSIELSSDNLEIPIGESVNVSAKVLPETTDQVVGWKSSNRSVAYVDTSASQPKIVAVGEGECEIEAYPANYPGACSAVCTIKVKALTECMYIVGSLNNWDYDDSSYSLDKISSRDYKGSIYFNESADHEFVLYYKKGNKSTTYYACLDKPIFDEYSMADPEIRGFNVSWPIESTSEKTFKLPSNWPGGNIEIECSFDYIGLGPEGGVVFDYDKTNQSRVESTVNDAYEKATYFNLFGIIVGDDASTLSPGVYIKRQGSKIEKIAIK